MGTTGNGKSKKRGAPKDNRNNMRHALRSGRLPKDAKYIEHRLNQFRRFLEDAVVAIHGKVSIHHAAAIQTSMRWERHACLAHRWLVKQWEELKPEQRLHFSREIAKASTERDKALKDLELGTEPEPLSLANYIEVIEPNDDS